MNLFKALKLAKKVSGKSDNETAVQRFLQKLNSSEMFYNKEKLPSNESDENAYRTCRNVEDAKKYCPKRWKAMEAWFADILTVRNLDFTTTLKFLAF
jgi:hypothetical protein